MDILTIDMPKNTETLSDLYHKSNFKIPKYQRGYQWSWDSEAKDLVQDIEYVQEKVAQEMDVNAHYNIEDTLVEISKEIDDRGEEFISEIIQEQIENRDMYTHYFGNIVFTTAFVDNQQEGMEIIDGQQRLTTICLLMKAVQTRLEALDTCTDEDFEYLFDEVQDKNAKSVKPGLLADIIGPKFTDIKGFKMDERSKETFNHIMQSNNVDEDSNYQAINFKSDLPEEIIDTEPQRRQKEVIDGINDHFDDIESKVSESAGRKFHGLMCLYYSTVANTVRKCFEITKYELHDKSEAGRFFQVINDRGKDIETWDRIRSLLVARCNEVKDNEYRERITNEIYNTIGETLQTLTENTELNDSDIDDFFQYHWSIFSGNTRMSSSKYDDVYDHMKSSDEHMSRKRSMDITKEWVELYLDSLRSCADSFKQMVVEGELFEQNEGKSKISKGELREAQTRLESIILYGKKSATYAFLMAVHQSFEDIDERFLNIIRIFDSYVFRLYGGQEIGSSWSYESNIKKLAHAIYWIGLEEHEGKVPEDVMGKNNNAMSDLEGIHKDNNLNEAYANACNHLELIVSKEGPDSLIRENLHSSGVHHDADSDAGEWNGFSGRKEMTFLLHIYDKHLGGKEYEEDMEFTRNKGIMEVEHIRPEVEEDDLENKEGTESEWDHIRSFQNKLGNLTLLTPQENKKVSDKDFEDKYRILYNNSPRFKITEEIGEMYDGNIDWNKEKVDLRTDHMIEWILDWWSAGMSRAEVFVGPEVDLNETGVRSDKDIKSKIMEDVEDAEFGFIKTGKEEIGLYCPRVKITKKSSERIFANEDMWIFNGKFAEKESKRCQMINVKQDEEGELLYQHKFDHKDSELKGIAARKPGYTIPDK